MNHTFQGLHKIRGYRKDEAVRQQSQRQRVLTQAEQLVLQRRQEQETARLWRQQQQQRLLSEASHQHLNLQALDDLRSRLGQLRDQELKRHDAVREAEHHQQESQEQLTQAQKATQRAARAWEKIDILQQQWQRSHLQALELAEEKQMEDYRPTPPWEACS